MKPTLVQFWIKAVVFCLPVIVPVVLDNFILPRGFFSFRNWEALIVTGNYAGKLPGMFYPNQSITRTEVGDLGNATPLAVEKHVTWVTDSHGTRNVPGKDIDPEIIIAGDSMTVGTSMDQPDILAEQLERASGLRTYGIPEFIGSALVGVDQQPRKPKFLIWEIVERNLSQILPREPKYNPDKPLPADPPKPRDASRDDLYVRLDYLRKFSPFRALRASLNREVNLLMGAVLDLPLYQRVNPWLLAKDGKMMTLQAGSANVPWKPEQIESVAQAIASYRDAVAARGVTLVFMPVPNKENIYWDQLTPALEPNLIPQLVARLKELGVPAVELQTPMRAARAAHPEVVLYQLDDTHWNKNGVRVAAEETAKVLTAPPLPPPQGKP